MKYSRLEPDTAREVNIFFHSYLLFNVDLNEVDIYYYFLIQLGHLVKKCILILFSTKKKMAIRLPEL